jgi:A/G-specific adenine glycosylase
MAQGARPEDAKTEIGACAAARLLGWYRRHGRRLPWRARDGEPVEPYRVWLSEVMLQQTTVASVEPYFHDFLARWPRLEDLAAAPLDRVLAAWAGLGYYARARNLHACARELCAGRGGRFPDTEAGLRALPGIGPYTAAAIAAIAFGRRAAVVDGNVERVLARLFAVETPLPAAKPELRRLALGLLPEDPEAAFAYGDYAQAMMDLGATVCLARRPRCARCPLVGDCRARALGRAEDLPRRVAKRARPTRRGIAFWLTRADGAVLLRRRAERGLLGGMMEVPSTEWREADWTPAEALAWAPLEADWRALPGPVRHGFTHFRLELEVWAGAVANGAAGAAGGRWTRPEDVGTAALPTLMRKVVRHALAATAATEP